MLIQFFLIQSNIGLTYTYCHSLPKKGFNLPNYTKATLIDAKLPFIYLYTNIYFVHKYRRSTEYNFFLHTNNKLDICCQTPSLILIAQPAFWGPQPQFSCFLLVLLMLDDRGLLLVFMSADLSADLMSSLQRWRLREQLLQNYKA